MSARYADLCAAIAGQPLPAMVVDLDAFDANVARVGEALRGTSLTMRLASKSLRVPALIARVLQRCEQARGVMCFSAREALALAGDGLDDLLVAYPTLQAADLRAVAEAAASGKRLILMADSAATVDALASAAAAIAPGAGDSPLPVALDVDMSLHLSERVHLGVRRSPLRRPREVVALARRIAAAPGLRFEGVMAYEAQVAGLHDDSPFERLGNGAKRAIRWLSVPRVARRRAAVVAALREAGLPPRLVNGGGTGSIDSTRREAAVTELTTGSAFFKPHLFDYFHGGVVTTLQPACYFALEVCRAPAPGIVTCLGGGYVASGPAGRDKVPLPWLPRGLSLLDMEMAGEVQTPLQLPAGVQLRPGAPVFFRHAKAGEISERFAEALLVRGGKLVGRVPTYRGQGRCFL